MIQPVGLLEASSPEGLLTIVLAIAVLVLILLFASVSRVEEHHFYAIQETTRPMAAAKMAMARP